VLIYYHNNIKHLPKILGGKAVIKKLLPLMAFLLVVLLVYLQPYTLPVKAVFSNSSQITIDGIFSDWGTVSLPATGVYVCQDYSNTGESDGNGFTNKSSDIEYIRVAVSTSLGGSEIASPSNPIHDFYYRIDTLGSTLSPGQSYYLQLNLGAATPGYADHLLQFWANLSATPNVTIVLYEYDSPYPVMGAFTSGNLKGKVSNVSNPYPGFITDGGVHDTAASGAIGLYDGAHYAVEVKIPAVWYSSLYGGMVADDGTGVDVILSAAFTGTGTIGAVGTVKDTVNDSFGNTISIDMETTTGDTVLSRPYLTFITGPQTITAGYSSGIITIQLMDAFGYPKVVSSNTNIALVSSSASGYFDTSSIGAFDGSITQITLLAGSSSVSFYYKDTTAGDITIGVSENPSMGWTDAAQHELIIAGDAAILTLTPTTGSAVVGNDFNLTATVTDSYGNPVSGSVIDWHSASLTASFIYYDAATDIEGLAHAVVSEITSGDSVFNATVNGYPLVTGSSTISWLSAAPAVLVVTDGLGNPIASPQTAGTAFTVMVKAYDRYGNVATSYNGSAYLSDLSGTLDITLIDFSGGVWTHDVTITKAYYHDHITATCVIVGCLSGTSNPFDVVAGDPVRLDLTPDSGTVTAGGLVTIEVTLYDEYDNIASGYTGTVRFLSTDVQAILPLDYTFTPDDEGKHRFSGEVIFKTAGTRIITAEDIAETNLVDTSSWSVNAAATAHFVSLPIYSHQTAGVPFSITILAVDEFGNQTDYNGDVTISDQSGTLTGFVISLSAGAGTADITITAAYLEDFISATDGDINGFSNNFDVVAAEPYILVLSPKIQMQTTGSPAILSAELYDQYGNPVPSQLISWSIASGPGKFTMSGGTTDTTISDTMGQSMLTLASGNAGLSRIVATSGVATDTANIVWNSPPFSTVVIPPETTTQGTTTSPTSVTPTAITSSSPATITGLPPTISTMPVTSTQPQNTNNQTSSVSTDLPVTVTDPPSSTSVQPDGNDAKQTGWLLALGITIGAVLSMLFLAYFKRGIYGEILCLPAMNPVSNAVVTLTNHKGKEVARFSTPADGKYHFRGLLPGEYQISVTGIACHSGKESSAQLTIRLFKSVIPKLFLYK
jgi:adhesin/invasin